MTLAGIYVFLAVLSAYCTFTAIVQARRIYWLAPVYFFSAWLCGELALIHVLWQVALTALLAFTGALADALATNATQVFSERGPHFDGLGSQSTVFVLQRR